MTSLQRMTALVCMLVVTGLAAGCGGGGGGGGSAATAPPPAPPPAAPPPPPPPAPPPIAAEPIVYLADQDVVGRLELYYVDPAALGVSVKLNGALAAGDLLERYSLSPTRTQVAYAVYEPATATVNLYVVDLGTPGTAVRVNPPLPPQGEVFDFVFSPDGTRIAYVAELQQVGRTALYITELSNPGVATPFSAPLPASAGIAPGHSFSADGSLALYAANPQVDSQFNLYIVATATPGVATQVNPPLVAGGNLFSGYRFSPDGSRVGYMADQDTDTVVELYTVAVAAPGVATRLNGPLVAGGDVCSFRFTPDSARVVYCADQATDGVIEMFVADATASGTATRLNPPLAAGSAVAANLFEVSPDGGYVVYRADLAVDGVNEIFRTDLTAPGVATRLNGTLVVNGDVRNFRISGAGTHVTYIADEETDGIPGLYVVDVGAPGASTRLNPALPAAGRDIAQSAFTANGESVLYRAQQDHAQAFEIFHVDLASPTVITKVNGGLVGAGSVADFTIAPGARPAN